MQKVFSGIWTYGKLYGTGRPARPGTYDLRKGFPGAILPKQKSTPKVTPILVHFGVPKGVHFWFHFGVPSGGRFVSNQVYIG